MRTNTTTKTLYDIALAITNQLKYKVYKDYLFYTNGFITINRARDSDSGFL